MANKPQSARSKMRTAHVDYRVLFPLSGEATLLFLCCLQSHKRSILSFIAETTFEELCHQKATKEESAGRKNLRSVPSPSCFFSVVFTTGEQLSGLQGPVVQN